VNSLARWRLLETWDASPAFNMGLDETLLEARDGPPTLRFYTWSPDTLSLGYFQRFADVPASEASAVVRRLTGGGAIHHVNELTFAFTCAATDPLYRGPVTESYVRIHRALAVGLGELGLSADLRGTERALSDRPDTGMCFHDSTPIDLMWQGRKGVGSAQRRRGGRILHHGSIKLASSPLEGEIATCEESSPGLGPVELARMLRRTLESELGLTLEEGTASEAELTEAKERGAHFVSPEFVRMR
jgi:lipoate-protein ligase A